MLKMYNLPALDSEKLWSCRPQLCPSAQPLLHIAGRKEKPKKLCVRVKTNKSAAYRDLYKHRKCKMLSILVCVSNCALQVEVNYTANIKSEG